MKKPSLNKERVFKVGDVITPKPDYNGFIDVPIYKIDKKYYYVTIINGEASIPIKTVENCYQLVEPKNKKK